MNVPWPMPPYVVVLKYLKAFVADAQAVCAGTLEVRFEEGKVLTQTKPAKIPAGLITSHLGRRYAHLEGHWKTLKGRGALTSYGFVDLDSGCVLYSSGGRPDPVPRGHLWDPIDPSHGRAALTAQGIARLDDPILDPDVLFALRVKYAFETITIVRDDGRWRPEGNGDEFYRIRVTSDRTLNDADAMRLFGLIGYAFREHFRGEPLGNPQRHGPNCWSGFYDITKSRSDDWLAHLDEALAAAREYAVEGTPVRTSGRKGPVGSRLAEGLGPIDLDFEFE
jgi:hypothetical protein